MRIRVLVAAVSLVAFPVGCDRASHTEPATSAHVSTETPAIDAAPAPAFAEPSTLASILARWGSGHEQSLVLEFLALAHGDYPDDRLRVTELTEASFAQPAPGQAEEIIAVTRRFKELAIATLEAGRAAVEAGDAPLAERCFDATERCAQLNSQPPLPDIVILASRGIANAARAARDARSADPSR